MLNEEATYHRIGATKPLASVMLLGASILRHGSEEQKKEFLPIIAAGEMNFCLGYSEPEAGSDLASLRTSAVRDGDDWVINGQKMWGTGAHTADWVWLAARTDRDATPRHAGITVFLFSLHTRHHDPAAHRTVRRSVLHSLLRRRADPGLRSGRRGQRRMEGHRRRARRRTDHDGQHRR